jgi:hypothetical protein
MADNVDRAGHCLAALHESAFGTLSPFGSFEIRVRLLLPAPQRYSYRLKSYRPTPRRIDCSRPATPISGGDEAREIVTRLKTITPAVVPSVVPFRNPEHCELFLSGLRLAAGE